MKILSYLLILLTFVGCFSKTEEDSSGSLFSGHKEAPIVLKLTVPTNKVHKENDTISFILTFPEILTVTGTPELALTFDSGNHAATYLSGSGTKALIFRYTVLAGDNDANGIDLATSVTLAGGNIEYLKNAVLTQVPLNFTAKVTSGLKIDTLVPSITSVTPPAINKTFKKDEVLNLFVNFNEAVNADPSSKLELDIGGVQKFANLVGGSGSSSLQFSYTVQSGDIDSDGIEMLSPLTLAAGDITDTAGNSAILTFVPTPMPTTLVNGDAPYITSVNPPVNATYYKGQLITLTVDFNEIVIISGLPQVKINIGGTDRFATYLSGSNSTSINFGYLVQAGEIDSDGVALGSLVELNGGSIQNIGATSAILSMTSPLTPGVLVDGSFPLITNITAPADDNYKTTENLDFIITFNKNVTVTGSPRVEITLDSGNIYADYLSGSGSSNLVFRKVVQLTDLDLDGISFSTNQIDLNGATINDAATNISASLLYNGVEPVLTGVFVNVPAVPTQLVYTTQPSNTGISDNISPAITVEIRDSSNDLVTTSTDNVTLSFGADPSAGSAILGGTLTVAAVGGIATFSDINIDTLGTGYTLVATSGSLTNDTSATFDIIAVPTQLVIINQPTNASNSTLISPAITVEIRDISNNIITDATNTVTIAISSDPSAGSAVLTGTLTKAAVNGIATFNDLAIDVVGVSYSLIVSSGSLTTDTSVVFDITQAPATQLVYTTQPSNTDKLLNITPAITVEFRDANNLLVPNETSNISLAIGADPSAGAAILAGTLTRAAVGGIATFNDISLDTNGIAYDLVTSSVGVTSATSNSFNISQVPTQLVITTEPSDALNSTIIAPAITIEIRDANNNLVTAATDNITIALSNDPSAGAAVLAGTLTQAAVGGIATFNDINIDTVGIGYTVIFTSGALTTATSISFDINQAPATQLVFTTQPTNTELSVNISPSITVEFRDANNLLVPNETSNISLAIGADPSAGAAIMAGTLSQAAVGGVASFNDINIDTNGIAYDLVASSIGVTSATSASFDIIQIPTQLVITTQPTNAFNNFDISPALTVEIRDANNNLVTAATDNITLALSNDPSAGAAVLAGTLTQAAVGGIATFNDINIDTIGVGYTVILSSGALTTATSASFDITQAPATQVVFIQDPSNVAVGANIAPSITVEFRDANNLLVPNETSNVSLVINNDPSLGAATLAGTLTQAAISGVATFNNINLDESGVGYTLDATSAGLTSATSAGFTVFRIPTQLFITLNPSNTEIGAVISPALTVEIRDVNNILVTDATDTVSIAIASDPSAGAATLGGTLSRAAVAGVAQFNDITIDTLGVGYTLIFSSGSLTSATSVNFDIIDTVISFSPNTQFDFGTVALGDSKDETLLLAHVGGSANPIAETTLAAPFTFKGGSYPGTGGTCGATINANCTVVVTYTPTVAITSNGSITIDYNSGNTTSRSLTGLGFSITPTSLAVVGPSAVVTNSCVSYTIQAVDANGDVGNVSAQENITLVINNGTGSFYSDAACTTATTTTNIANGTSSQMIYFSSNTAAQSLTLIFNAATLDNTSEAISTSNEPTFISANIPSEIIKDTCTVAEVSLVDPNGIKTGASTAQLVNIADNGDAVVFTDSFCTNQVTSLNYAAFEGSKTVYLMSPSLETVSFDFTDNAAILTADNASVDFVSNLTWWDTNYQKRVRVSIDNLDIPDTFTNMPILIKLDNSKINYADFLGSANDIRFTLDDHTTTLDYSIDTWDSSGTSYLWVKLDSIAANSEINIYMYYSYNAAINNENGTAIWNDYEGVWLMNKTGATYNDETANARNGTANGTITDVPGPVGNAVSFDGASTLKLTYNLALTLGHSTTTSFWMKTSQVGSNTDWQAPGLFGLSGTAASQDLFLSFINAAGNIGSSAGGGTQVQSNFVVNDNTWRYVTVSRNETTGEFRYYINGVLNGSGNSGTGYKSQPFYDFGATTKLWGGGGFFYYNGAMDSMRMSSSILSDNRIKAEYKFTTDTHVQIAVPEDL